MAEPRLFYFVPKKIPGDLTPEAIAALDLADRLGTDPAVPERTYEMRVTPAGPGGTAGTFLHVAHPGVSPSYSPDTQEWHEFPRWWIGWEKALRPGPADLLRPDHGLRTFRVLLRDQQGWQVPVALLQPRSRVFDGEKWTTKRPAEHDALWAVGERVKAEWWDRANELRLALSEAYLAYHADQAAKPDDPGDEDSPLAKKLNDAMDAVVACNAAAPIGDVCRVLAYCYRIGQEEVGALALLREPYFAESDEWAIIDAFLDGETIRSAPAKKTEAPGD